MYSYGGRGQNLLFLVARFDNNLTEILRIKEKKRMMPSNLSNYVNSSNEPVPNICFCHIVTNFWGNQFALFPINVQSVEMLRIFLNTNDFRS